VLRVARDLGVRVCKVRYEGSSVLLLNGSRSTYSGLVPSIHPLGLLDVNALLCETDRLAATINRENPWDSPSAASLDAMTVQQWLDDYGQTSTAKLLYQNTVRAIVAKHPAEVSMLYWLWYVACSQGVMRLVETNNGAQECKLVGGTQQLSTKMCEMLNAHAQAHFGHQAVHFNMPVRQVIYGSVTEAQSGYPMDAQTELWTDQVRVVASNGEEFVARHLIFGIGPSLMQTIEFKPRLPALRNQLNANMPMGSVIKTIMRYRRPFWLKAVNGKVDYSGTMFSDQGPVSFTFDDSHPIVAEGEKSGSKGEAEHFYGIMGFCYADHCRAWTTKTREERKAAICAQFARAFDNPEALDPLEYIEQNWCEETWSNGCYVGVCGPKILTSMGKVLRQPIGLMHFAGTETATKHAGYMDGAIQAGERAAYEVVGRLVSGKTASHIRPLPAFVENEPVDHRGSCIPRPIGPSAIEKLLPRPNTVVASLVALAAAIGWALGWKRYAKL
jgi:monoamine oxidase